MWMAFPYNQMSQLWLQLLAPFRAELNLHNNANKLSTKHSCNYLEAELCPRISSAYFSNISLGHSSFFGSSPLAAHLMLKCLNWILYLVVYFCRKRKPFRHSIRCITQIEIFKCHGNEVTTVFICHTAHDFP